MTRSNTVKQMRALSHLPGWVRENGYGFLYWLAFLLVLEPDNVFRAIRSGHELAFNHEALRIAAAALLGATVTPLILFLARRYPVLGPGLRGPGWWRRAQIHLGGVCGLAFGLIVASCFLAAWGFEGKWLPSIAEVCGQIMSNGPLLVYAVFALGAIAHGVQYFHSTAPGISHTEAMQLRRIRVESACWRNFRSRPKAATKGSCSWAILAAPSREPRVSSAIWHLRRSRPTMT